MTDRFEIAADLRAIASLLKIKGANPFKAQAYERGAAALENFEGDLDRVVKEHRLRGIAGIGSGLSAVIEEIHTTGECRILQQLRDEMPIGAAELSEIPGLTLKKIIALNETLHIESIAELKSACEEGLVSKVKGFGVKSQAKLLSDIEKLEKPRHGFLLLNAALAEAERILAHLRVCPELIQAEPAGALRRRKETISRICIVAASNQPKLVVERFLRYPALARTEELEDGRCLGRLAGGISTELVIVQPEHFAATLHKRTGSRKHVAKLEEIASTKTIAESTGTRRKNKISSVETETEIYRRLALPYIPPEMREDEGEIEAAKTGTLPTLLSLDDIRGMTHCHTLYSDGRNSIEEMARAAEAMGMAYLTITDHSQSAYYARGLRVDRVRAQWDEIARVQESVKITLLKGTESDILADGALDYPDYLLGQFDIVIASIHARHKMDSDQMTVRLLRAIKSPIFKIWGHPLGRLLQSRPPFSCRMEEVLDGLAESKGAIEINGDPRRLDLEPRWIRAARQRGIKFIVSTDAHSTGGMSHLPFGVAMARRGWVTREEVLNTLDSQSFTRAVHP
ncbi:MAG TPA: DNA polymerase/3'-5' exonuclease PolX [Candidatus Binatia bacterium]|jgi:DNA polymerase (family 10)